jgi:hypothetical protein
VADPLLNPRNTISDAQRADLNRRAARANPGMFDPKTVRQRLASERQRQQRKSS